MSMKWFEKQQRILESYNPKDENYVCSEIEEIYKGNRKRFVKVRVGGNDKDICDSVTYYIAKRGG